MKKVLIIAIALVLILQLGCSKTAANGETATTTTAATQQPTTTLQPTTTVLPNTVKQSGDNAEQPLSNAADKLEVVLPPIIYGVVDKEVNIYFENIMNARAQDYQLDVTCEIGSQLEDRWTAVPLFAGEYDFKVDICKNNAIVGTASTKITVSDKNAGEGTSKTCLVIGDSTTYYGITTGELLELFADDAMDLTLIGSRGKNGNFHEGISSYTVEDFLSNRASPFKFGEFDMNEYMLTYGYEDLDYVIINLGINDVFDFEDDESLNAALPAFMENYQLLVDKIKAYDPNLTIGVCVTIPPAASQNAFGKSFGCKQTQFRVKRNNIMWNKALIAHFDGKEGEGIYLIPINVNIDTVNNYPAEAAVTNSRNETEILIQKDGIHPADSGYYQIADSYYYWIKSLQK